MIVGILSVFLPSMVSTLWIPHKIYKSLMWDYDNRSKIVKGKWATDYPHTVESVSKETTLVDMFQCGERFEKLMTWLFKEFNYELGLFLVEIIQFKQYMVQHLIPNDTQRTGVDGDAEHSIPSVSRYQRYLDCCNDSMPRSAIIRRTHALTTMNQIAKCRRMAQLLFEKYIAVGAEFMLNVEGATRTRFTRLAATNWQMSNEEFVVLYDNMIEMMLGLAGDTFLRYKIFQNANPRPK